MARKAYRCKTALRRVCVIQYFIVLSALRRFRGVMLRGEARDVSLSPRSPRTPSRSQRTRRFVHVFTYFFPKCLISDQDGSAFLFFDYFSIKMKVFFNSTSAFLISDFYVQRSHKLTPIRAYVKNSIFKNYFLEKNGL